MGNLHMRPHQSITDIGSDMPSLIGLDAELAKRKVIASAENAHRAGEGGGHNQSHGPPEC